MDLRANTAVDVLIGPFVDKTDGNTTEDALTLTAAEIKLSKNGQALTLKSDVTSAAFDDDGYYNCELDATDTDTEGTLVLIVHQAANALPVRHEFDVISEAAWDSRKVAKDAGFMDVNIKTIGRADAQETEADNLEAAAAAYSVTRGLAGTALPAIVANLAGGLQTVPAGGVVESSGSNSDTQVQTDLAETTNGHYDVMTILFTDGDEAGQSRLITGYVGSTGVVSWNAALTGTPADGVAFIILAAGTTADAVWDEILTGASHNIQTSAGRRLREISATIFNSGTAQAGGNNSITLESGASTVDDFYNRARVIIIGGLGEGQEAIITEYVGSTLVASVTPAWTTNPDATSEYEVVPAQVHTTVQNGGYDGGKVYFDSVNGVAGTVKGVNGTSTNPSSVEADAYTIMGVEKISTLQIEPGSTFTLPSDSSNKTLEGEKYDLAMNSQAISGTTFRGAEAITGIGTLGAGVPPAFFLCGIGDVTLPPSSGFQCGFFGTLTIGSAGNFTWTSSGEVFNASLTLDYGAALNASQFFLTGWNGGSVEIQNAGAGTGTYVFELNGNGDLVINANCSATTNVFLRGNVSLTNNASGLTIDLTANSSELITTVKTETALIVADTNEIQADQVDGGRLDLIWDAIKVETDKLGDAMPDSIAADGSINTPIQALYMIQQVLTDFKIVGTTLTVRKVDGSTTLFTSTLDDGTSPTDVSRTT